MRRSSPLSFVVTVLAGWAAVRTAIVFPLWTAPPADAAGTRRIAEGGPGRPVPGEAPETGAERPAPPSRTADRRPLVRSAGPRLPSRPTATRRAPPVRFAALAAAQETKAPVATAPTGRPAPFALLPGAIPSAPPAPLGRGGPRRWSLSAWSFVRRGDSAPLAAVGLLGGSQAGARLTYRLAGGQARPLALSLRAASPLRRRAGAEAALGLDWKPAARLPVHLLAERRQAIGEEGRSAFAITLYGGVGDARLGRFRLDAYAQAGLVGARSRDPFGDGSLRISLPLGSAVRLGAGAWAAAQPGAARLDLGPQAALRLPLAGRSVSLAADWRLRVAGDARPGSGPALTLATDF